MDMSGLVHRFIAWLCSLAEAVEMVYFLGGIFSLPLWMVEIKSQGFVKYRWKNAVFVWFVLLLHSFCIHFIGTCAVIISLALFCLVAYAPLIWECLMKQKQITVMWTGMILAAIVLLFPPRSEHLYWGEYRGSGRTQDAQQRSMLIVIVMFTAGAMYTLRDQK